MSLVTAARELQQSVKSARDVRLRYTARRFPDLIGLNTGALAHWVQLKLASGELVLIRDLTLNVDGQWENYRFMQPEQAPNQ